MAVANSWRYFDAGRGGKCCCNKRRPDHWKGTIWLHAAEPHGLGRAHPSLSADDHHCDPAGARRGSGEYQEMECGWSTGPRRPFDRGSLFIGCIQIDGGAWDGPSCHCVPLFLARCRDNRGTLSKPIIVLKISRPQLPPLLSKAVLMNSTRRRRASNPCQGSVLGNPYIFVPNGP